MLVMTLLVKNELDLIEANVNFHRARGVEHFVVTDNGSTDGTRELLDVLAKRVPMTVWDETGDDYSQHRWVTRMALWARDELAADWIINNDADEFWLPPAGGDLRSTLAATNADIVMCERRNMVFAWDEDAGRAPWYERAVYRAAVPQRPVPRPDPINSSVTHPHFMNDLPGKAALRGPGLVAVAQGNHDAQHEHKAVRVRGDIFIYHYPVRSREQFESKVRQGGAAYARNTELPISAGWHWRRWFAAIEREGLNSALCEALPSSAMVQSGLADGSIMEDRTMVREFDGERANTNGRTA